MLPVRAVLLLLAVLPAAARAQDPKPVPDPTALRNVRPPGPAVVRAMVSAPGEVTVTWDSVPGASGYDLGRLAPPAGWVRLARVPGASRQYVDRGRNLTTPHTYRVIGLVGEMASLPTQSEPVSGPPTIIAAPRPDPMAGRFCSGTVGDTTVESCYLTKTWADSVSTRGVQAEISCPARGALSGGGFSGVPAAYRVVASRPTNYNGQHSWRVELVRDSAVSAYGPVQLSVWALCRVLR